MTGNDNPAVRVAAHQSGWLAYLTKPFSERSLIEPLQRTAAGLAYIARAVPGTIGTVYSSTMPFGPIESAPRL
jgi:DNA-binding NarL/FixJ family response regulator